MFNKLVLASSNAGKVAELQSLLADEGIEVLPQSQFKVPDADETGLSFIENAILKARHAAKLTGLPAIADDSGLAVHDLGGAPGIYSARYAAMHDALREGESKDAANIRFLLQQMEHHEDRRAEFHCVLALCLHADDPVPLIAHGRWQGLITREIRGDGGFGYDPIFWLPEQNKTSAQLSKAEKSLLSHRGQALRLLLAMLKA